MQPGWFPDPDDPSARRYWDGMSWSAPLPKEAGQAAPVAPKASWQATAEQAGTAIPLGTPTCAVGPCTWIRIPGSEYCNRHGPSQSAGDARIEGKRARAVAARDSAQRIGSNRLVCPHCQVTGRVTSKQVKMKKGVSGGKLTGAVLTGGISMLGTGLSRKEKVTEMSCGNCKTVWHV